MILLLIALVSLSAIYFTRLLSKKKMKAAAISVAVLYIYLIAWTYAVFVLDVADLGFSDTETRISLLHASDIYHSFVSITDKMSVIPLGLLKVIVAIAALVLAAGFSVAFHGLFEIAKAVIKAVKEKELFASVGEYRSKLAYILIPFSSTDIIRLYCRMNC